MHNNLIDENYETKNEGNYCKFLNDYHIELSCIINIIQYCIYLGIFLVFFVDYSNYSFKRHISLVFIFFTCFGGRVIFMSIKSFQYRNLDRNNFFIPIFLMLNLIVFKSIFFLEYGNQNIMMNMKQNFLLWI